MRAALAGLRKLADRDPVKRGRIVDVIFDDLEWYMANPSWCFDVMTMYRCPAAFAI